MSPFLRKVRTASGATAVQIVEKRHGARTILEHLGSARDEAELAALLRIGHEKPIEAYLTIVFTALAIARDLQARSGWSLTKIIRGLRPLQHVTIQLAGQQLNAEPAIPDNVAELLTALGH